LDFKLTDRILGKGIFQNDAKSQQNDINEFTCDNRLVKQESYEKHIINFNPKSQRTAASENHSDLNNFANSEPINLNRFGAGISRNSSSKDMSGFTGESDCSNKENPLD